MSSGSATHNIHQTKSGTIGVITTRKTSVIGTLGITTNSNSSKSIVQPYATGQRFTAISSSGKPIKESTIYIPNAGATPLQNETTESVFSSLSHSTLTSLTTTTIATTTTTTTTTTLSTSTTSTTTKKGHKKPAFDEKLPSTNLPYQTTVSFIDALSSTSSEDSSILESGKATVSSVATTTTTTTTPTISTSTGTATTTIEDYEEFKTWLLKHFVCVRKTIFNIINS
jgi:hypothetical protein